MSRPGTGSQETIDELRRALDRPTPTTRAALEEDLRTLVPLIVPREYFSVGVPAPEHRLSESTLSLTWVLLQPTTMLYLSVDEAARFDKEGFPWQARATQNLARAPGGLATHEKRSPDGRLIWMAAMHADGLGSSRLLLEPAWKGEAFGD